MLGFEYIYNRDGSCLTCGSHGLILAYDVFSPEGAMWFCTRHWDEEGGFVVVLDQRPYIGPPHQLPKYAASIGPEIAVWATSTDMGGTQFERKTYCCILRDGDRETKFNLQVHAGGIIVVEPYVTHEFDYLDYDYDDNDDDYSDD